MSAAQIDKKYIAVKELAARFSVSTKTIWNWAKLQPDFPQPIIFSGNCTRWNAEQVDAWARSRENAA